MCLSLHQVVLELMVLWGKCGKVINSGVVQRWLGYQDSFHNWSGNEWWERVDVLGAFRKWSRDGSLLLLERGCYIESSKLIKLTQMSLEKGLTKEYYCQWC